MVEKPFAVSRWHSILKLKFWVAVALERGSASLELY
jgi:hypothetical protein